MIGKDITFVPNSFCNMGCSYCYLGSLTDRREDSSDVALKFKTMADKLIDEGVVITSVSLHGAEATAMPKAHLKSLLEEISQYRQKYSVEINALKRLRSYIQIKTNLLNFDSFYELFCQHEVRISGSLDLPFSAHKKHRTLKNGASSLEKILENIKLLVKYPHGKGLSATMSKEHLKLDEFVDNVYELDSLGFDMKNDFYIMFAYSSTNAKSSINMADDRSMVEFYNGLRQRFKGSKFAPSVEYVWFKEFLGGYCNQACNCGDMLLIQKDGDCYNCHRAQAKAELKSGNIFKQSLKQITDTAIKKTQIAENRLDLHSDCLECDYFHLCNASCVIERTDTGLGKSYTCALQKEIYKNNPDRFIKNPILANRARDEFLRQNQISRHKQSLLPRFSDEIYSPDFSLENIIAKDKILKKFYDDSNFLISINGTVSTLDFNSINPFLAMHEIGQGQKISVWVKKSAFSINCHDVYGNSLVVMLLRDTDVRYGDEGRTKMEHIANLSIYYNELLKRGDDRGEYVSFSLDEFLLNNKSAFIPNVVNQIYFTTMAMREYHYQKHAKNAFYHLQAINLPFACFSFGWGHD